MRIGAFILFVLATALMSMLDGLGASAAAFVLCSIGACMIASRHLSELAAETEEPDVSIRVIRWNY